MSWKKVKLGDLCTIEKGKTGIQKAIPGDYPLVVTGEERKTNNEYQFDAEAVIIPLVSGTGHGHASIKRLHFQKGKFALGSILCAVIPKDQNTLNADYLFRFLTLNKERELVDRMKGMANVTLPIKEIVKIEIPLPPLNEQIKFIEKYQTLEIKNGLINVEFTKQIDLIKQLRQAFLREAMQGRFEFKQQPLQDGELETGAQLLEKIKAEKAQLIKEGKLKKEKPLPPITADEIPFEIPDNWVWCRLGEVCNYGSSPKAEPKDFNENTWVLDLEDIEKETSILLNKIRFNERNSLSTKSVFKKGQVLYSKLRPYLDKVIVAEEDGVCTTEILPLKLYGNINPYFTKYALKRSDFLIYVNSVTKGMKMPRLGTNDGQIALFPLPPLHEQQQIVAKLDELMAFCDDLEESIKESQGLNEILLQEVLREALQGEGV
jgi:type I restriction enzyme S subunit